MDNPQPTNSQILEAIQKQGESINALTSKVDGINRTVDGLVESVDFIKDNVMTRDETLEKLTEFKSDIISNIDGFAKKQEKFDQELASAKDRQDRIELRLDSSRA